MINSLFDDKGYKELKEVYNEQAHQSQGDWPAVLDKVLFEGQEIFKCFYERESRFFHGIRNTGIRQELSMCHKVLCVTGQ